MYSKSLLNLDIKISGVGATYLLSNFLNIWGRKDASVESLRSPPLRRYIFQISKEKHSINNEHFSSKNMLFKVAMLPTFQTLYYLNLAKFFFLFFQILRALFSNSANKNIPKTNKVIVLGAYYRTGHNVLRLANLNIASFIQARTKIIQSEQSSLF